MKISLGSDHAGYRYKEKIKKFLTEQGHEVEDFGTHSVDSCDYPDFVAPAVEAVANGICERGVVLGGSGNGEAMVANRFKGIRCGLCRDQESAKMTRLHNDSNVLSLGERMIAEDQLLSIVQIWLQTPFEGGRHVPRINKIDGMK